MIGLDRSDQFRGLNTQMPAGKDHSTGTTAVEALNHLGSHIPKKEKKRQRENNT